MNTLADEQEWDVLAERHYSSQLRALHEESLCCSDLGPAHIVRFTRLPSFSNPVVIRADFERGRWLLRTKVASGKGGYSPGHLIVSNVRELTDAETAQLLAAVDGSSGFWALPNDVSDPDIIMTDGATWILEVRHDSTYHFITANWPDSGLLHEVGSMLTALSGDDLEDKYR